MRLSTSNIYKIILSVLSLAVFVVIICGTWLYTGRLNESKINFFTKFYLPYALVNGSPISINEFVFRYNLAKKIEPGLNGQIEAQVSSQLVKEEEIRQLSSRLTAGVSQKQITEEYGYQTQQGNPGKKAVFENLLSSYGLNADEYKNEVIKPQLFYINLKIWYNSQASQNSAAYKQANSLLQQISGGVDMAGLAAQYSQDELGKNTEGDLGFIQITNLLPELREPISNMAVGDVKIVPDRNGLHIFKIEAENDNRTRLRDIYIKTNNFDQWLAGQLNGFNVHLLLKL